MREDLVLLIVSFLGVIGHSLMKMDHIKKLYKAANLQFNWITNYVKEDAIAIILSFIPPIAWYFLFGEAASKLTWLENYVRISFFTVGGAGSYFLQLWFSNAEKFAKKVVDIKTDVSDSVMDKSIVETLAKSKNSTEITQNETSTTSI